MTTTDDLSLDHATVARGLETLPATTHPLTCGHSVRTRGTAPRTARCRDCRREVASAERVEMWRAARSTECHEGTVSCLDGSLSAMTFHELGRERIAASHAISRSDYARLLRGETVSSPEVLRFYRLVREMHLRGIVALDGSPIVRTTFEVCS